ncbi:MAG: hypothetical protein SFV52_03790 [Saprospiraceae bacterium]|nr:hypothetical protein [Saprospiraceae bacterium]
MKKHLVICLIFFCTWMHAQDTGAPLGSPAYHIVDRMSILHDSLCVIRPEVKFYARRDLAGFAIALDSSVANLSRLDQADIDYLLRDNNEWVDSAARTYNDKALLRFFYQSPANLFEMEVPHFYMRINPILNLEVGQEQDNDLLLGANQRGIEVRGGVDEVVTFYTSVIESQARYPDYVYDHVEDYKAVPRVGFYKPFKRDGEPVEKVFDFNVANAYIGVQATKHIGIQFGHSKHFIGNGYRSLFLSDFGNYTFFLKFNTRVWKFQYQNLFMELSPTTPAADAGGDDLLPKKYTAMHYLNFQASPRLSFGLYEATVFHRINQFEFQYLNPIILYRTVEGMLGSPDNVLLGADVRWNLFKRVQLYGQFFVDELVFSELFAGDGWWGNKYGLQAGAKYINAFGVDHLDLRGEMNAIRPYTYSHFDSLSSYTHYNQPLAHPLWANFVEFIGIARYQPTHRWTATGRLMYAKVGDDPPGENWGTNPLLDYDSRVQDYGNTIGQGIGATIALAGLDVGFQFYHNMYLDLKVLYRRKDSEDDNLDQNTLYVGAALRLNFWQPELDF